MATAADTSDGSAPPPEGDDLTLPGWSSPSERGNTDDLVTEADSTAGEPTRAAPPPAEDPADDVIPGYEVIQMIARGGMGEVYQARQENLDRLVALKIVRGNHPAALNAHRRFLREARIQGRLEHPGITPVHELGTSAAGQPYFSMKEVRGRTLSSRLREVRDSILAGEGDSAFSLRARLDVFRKVCDAAGYAHAHDIIHRDLKPQNIMMGEFGEVQLMDWGLARFVGQPADEDEDPSEHDGAAGTSDAGTSDAGPSDAGTSDAGTSDAGPSDAGPSDAAPPSSSDPAAVDPGTARPSATAGAYLDSPTMAGMVLGTPSYMSPEQASGHTAELTAKSDVFALGAVLYTILTFDAPFRDTTHARTLDRARRNEFVSPADTVAASPGLLKAGYSVPRELDSVVAKAMASEPEDRYASAAELRDEIDRFLDGRFVQAIRYTPGQIARKWLSRHWRVVVSLTLLAALAIAAAIYGSISIRDARQRQIDANLAEIGEYVAELSRDLTASRRLLTSGRRYLASLRLADSVLERQPAVLQIVTDSALARQHRPHWRTQLLEIPGEAADIRSHTMAAWLAATISHYSLGASGTELDRAEVASLDSEFQAMLPYRDLATGAGLDLGAVPLAMARTFAARIRSLDVQLLLRPAGDPELENARQVAARQLVRHVVGAWRAQPSSPSAAEAFLVLCDHAATNARSAEAALQSARLYHLVLTLFGQDRGLLRVRCLLGMARQLACVAPRSIALNDPDVRASDLALRCLLQLVTPDGALTEQTSRALRGQAAAQIAELVTETRDLLEITRRSHAITPLAAIAEPVPWLPGVFWRYRGRNILLTRARVPEDEPLAAPILTAEQEIPLDSLFRTLGGSAGRLFVLPTRPGGAQAVLERQLDGHPSLVVLDDLVQLSVRCVLDVPIRPWMLTQGDVDGDGLADLCYVAGYEPGNPRTHLLHVLLGQPEGGYSTPIVVGTPYDEADARWREAREILAVDLDGDGTSEIVVTRGIVSRWTLDVFGASAAGADELQQIGHVDIGAVGLEVMDADPVPILALSPLTEGSLDYSLFADLPASKLRPHLLQLRDGALVDLEIPWRLDSRHTGIGSRLSLFVGDLAGSSALSEQAAWRPAPPLGKWSGLCRWLIWDGALTAPQNPRVRYSYAQIGPVTAALCRARTAVTRRLGDEGLAQLAELPIPPLRMDLRASGDDLDLARLLVEFGFAEAAAALLASQPSSTPLDAGRRALIRARALREAGDGEGLLAQARELAPAADLVDAFVATIDAFLDMGGRYEDVLDPTQKWMRSTSISRHQRERLAIRYEPLHRTAELLEVDRFELQNCKVMANGRPIGSLAECWFCDDPTIVQPGCEFPWSALSRPAASRSEDERFQRLAALRRDEDGRWTVWRVTPRSGIAVSMSSGAVRFSIELELPANVLGTQIGFVLTPLDEAGKAMQLGKLSGAGVPDVVRFEFRGQEPVRIDPLVGAHLRIDYELLHLLGKSRVTLTDMGSQRVVHSETMPLQPLPHASQYVLGLSGEGPAAHQFLIRSLDIRGTATPVKVPPLLRDGRASFTAIEATRAQRALIAGRPHDAADALEDLAAASSKEARQRDDIHGSMLDWQAQRYRAEAAWLRADGDPENLGMSLAVLIENDRVPITSVLQWALMLPLEERTVQLWAGIGVMLEELGGPRSAADGEGRGQQLPVDALEALLGIARAARDDADGLVRAVAHAYDVDPQPTLGYWLRTLVESRGDAADLPEELRIPYLRTLISAGDRARVLATARPGDDELLGEQVPSLLEVTRQVHRARVRALEMQILDCERRGAGTAPGR